MGSSVARVKQHQPGVIDPGIGIAIAGGKARFQRHAGYMTAQIDALRRRQGTPSAQMIVDEQAQAQQPAWAQPRRPWQCEAHRMDDMRRDTPQTLPLGQRLAHQTEFAMFQIAQPAMDELGGGGGRALRQVASLQQQHLRAPARRIAGDAAAIHPAANHGQIIEGGWWALLGHAIGCRRTRQA